MISVSLVILTYNRQASVGKSLSANLNSAGYPIKELIHVDNGSEPGLASWFKSEFNPDIQVLHTENLGVAKGYNRGMLLATGSHICITGMDRIMPHLWLKTFANSIEAIPETGVISCYTDVWESRMRSPIEIINGVPIRRAEPCEARIHSREFLLGAGFFREDFGLYSHEDCEWMDRANAYAYANNLINYMLPDLGKAYHLPDGRVEGSSYLSMKESQKNDPRKDLLVQRCHREGSPYYNPYSRIEKDLLNEGSSV